MERVTWHENDTMLTISAKRSAMSVRQRIQEAGPDWVILRQSTGVNTGPRSAHLYVFRKDELVKALTSRSDETGRLPVGEVLTLRQEERSTLTHGRRPDRMKARPHDMEAKVHNSYHRVVHVTTAGKPVCVGERVRSPYDFDIFLDPAKMSDFLKDNFHLSGKMAGEKMAGELSVGGLSDGTQGRARKSIKKSIKKATKKSAEEAHKKRITKKSGDPPPNAAPVHSSGAEGGEDLGSPEPKQPTISASISATAPAHVQRGAIATIQYRLEAGTLTSSDDSRFQADLDTETSIRVVLMIDGDAVEAVGARIHEVDPPTSSEARTDVFEVKGRSEGDVTAALLFRQGGQPLGSLLFEMTVVGSAPVDSANGTLREEAPLPPPPATREELLTLLIEQQSHGTEVRYRYRLDSEELGMNYLERTSSPLKSAAGQPLGSERAFIEDLYRRVTQDVLSLTDARRLGRTVRAVGASLCEQLFDPDVTRELWQVRDRIQRIEIVSWEPFIPWEMLFLRSPERSGHGDNEGLFLSEFGLIRSMPGLTHARELPMRRWKYLAAEYKNIDEVPVSGEVEYLRSTLPAKSIHPEAVAGTYDDFFDVLEAGDFDVLHLACHGKSDHGNIDSAELIIGDRKDAVGNGVPVSVDALTVRQEARLNQGSLVFLNACESGRLGPSLTTWGGWPTAFLKAGAGAFVGTAWPVREKPATAFTRVFYDSLLQGDSLSDAATAARTAIKDMGDASWLAYKVYGHPFARRSLGGPKRTPE